MNNYTQLLNASMYASMIKGGAINLDNNRTIVNDLNVFPVPDGDTGDNMFMTINSGYSAVKDLDYDAPIDEIATKIAKGMLLGARGNSGVILSRIFAGIARGLSGLNNVNVKQFGLALEAGVKEAYNAVKKPVEGTILTVYKDAVEYANSKVDDGSSFEDFFNTFIFELRNSLDRTPELLEVLKQAGVVDSGGAGFVYIAEGMKKVLFGEKLDEKESSNEQTKTNTVDLSKFNENSVLEYGYCTEFLLQLQNSKVDALNFDVDIIKSYLNNVGDSVVCFKEGTIVKAHVHTKEPGVILNTVQHYGEFLTLKIENMTLQHNEATIQNNYVSPKKVNLYKKYGIVTVASGSGIKNTFLELGVDMVIDGGQSMNPSTEDFIKAFDEINADTILVYPNNSNIIMAANQAKEIYEKCNIEVIPTKTIGQGYAAISMLDTTENIENIIEQAKETMDHVVTGEVSKASRNSNFDNFNIKENDYIGFVHDNILSCEKTLENATLSLAKTLNPSKFDLMLLVKGKDTSEEEASNLINKLNELYSGLEIILINGEQPIYNYILILE